MLLFRSVHSNNQLERAAVMRPSFLKKQCLFASLMLITAQAPTGSLILSLSPHRKDESNSHPSDTAKDYTASLLR